ncbi:MAG: SEC59/DGK1/VTE5 family protein [Candidatus Woesearchaeota archaeon]
MDKVEFRRQVFHLVSGIVLTLLLYFGVISRFHMLVFIPISILISIFSIWYRLPFFAFMLEKFDRKTSLIPGQGAITFLIGSVAALYLFEKNIAYASILILSLGDSVAPIVGINYGRRRMWFNKKRYLEGMIAGFVASALAASIFVPFIDAFIASFLAMLIETIEVTLFNRHLDDNLYLPVVAGVVLSFLK